MINKIIFLCFISLHSFAQHQIFLKHHKVIKKKGKLVRKDVDLTKKKFSFYIAHFDSLNTEIIIPKIGQDSTTQDNLNPNDLKLYNYFISPEMDSTKTYFLILILGSELYIFPTEGGFFQKMALDFCKNKRNKEISIGYGPYEFGLGIRSFREFTSWRKYKKICKLNQKELRQYSKIILGNSNFDKTKYGQKDDK